MIFFLKKDEESRLIREAESLSRRGEELVRSCRDVSTVGKEREEDVDVQVKREEEEESETNKDAFGSRTTIDVLMDD